MQWHWTGIFCPAQVASCRRISATDLDRSSASPPTPSSCTFTHGLVAAGAATVGDGVADAFLVDFAAGQYGQFVDDGQPARHFVPGQGVAQEVLDAIQGQLRAGSQHDDRGDGFTPPGIRCSDHRAVHDLVEAAQRKLDLWREHVFPTADDHVLLPVDQIEQPVLSMRPISPV